MTSAVIGLVFVAAASVTARPEAPPRPGDGDEIQPSPNVLVKVGADCVTSYGVQREVGIQMRGQDAARRKRLEAGSWTDEDEAKLSNVRALLAVKSRNELVARALMAEIALEAGYRPNERQLERRLRSAVKKAGSIEALVRKEGRSLNGIRELLRQQDLQGRFFRNFIPQDPGPGPREIREHYEANRAALKSPSSVRVRIIFVSSASDRKAAFEKADGLKRELRYAPDRFALRARESSDHKETAERGGLMVADVGGEKVEWVPSDQLARVNPVVAQVAQKLQPGRVSDVVPLADGFLLVKLEGYKKGRDLTLPEVADRITQALARETENRLIGDWIEYYLRRTYLVDSLGRRVGDRPRPGAEGGAAGRAEAYLNRGVAYAKKGDLDRAIADFTKAIELRPGLAKVYINRGKAHDVKGDHDRAIADYTKAIELKPDHAEVYNDRGAAYADKGQFDRAIADFTKAIKLKTGNAKAYGNRGVVYAEKGELDRAIADCMKAIQLKPGDAEAHSRRGAVYRAKGEFDRAIADYTKAIELKPDFAEAYSNRGNAYAGKGEFDRAIADFTKAIELKPDFAKAWTNRGTAHGDKGDHDRAIADFTRGMELRPNFAEAYNWRGFAYAMKGDLDRAIADFTKAIKLKPGNAKAYSYRGVAYATKGDLDRARADLEKAVELDPKGETGRKAREGLRRLKSGQTER